MVQRSETFYATRGDKVPPPGTPRAFLPAFYFAPPGRLVAIPGGTAPGKRVEARVNHGRWLVECPTCAAAQVASHGDRRFLCHGCLNAASGGKWIRVDWPPPPVIARVEELLDVRDVEHQNWTPDEPIEWLEAENERHGLPT